MAQGLDLKSWSGEKSPTMDNKNGEPVKRPRGVGSRRIFPPQFKLQVLDSYRNDVDCRGNQRATARKYNIHRRQIQKWLQCEQYLRTSVEESAKNDINESKPRKKMEVENKTDLTLSQSAMGFGRLSDANTTKELRPIFKQENKVCCAEDSKLESQNLKRVAQKLYPSLHGIPCVQGEKVMHPSVNVDGQKFYHGDVACAFSFPQSPTETRDDNFNKVFRTDDRALDLKSKVRSEILPEKFLVSNVESPLLDDNSDKLKIREEVDDELALSKENIGGQKLSVSNAVLKCLVQKYTDDVDGQEFHARDTKNNELLFSHDANRTESSCLLDVQVPNNSNSVPYLLDSAFNKNVDSSEENVDVATEITSSPCAFEACPKKPKTDFQSKLLDRLGSSKSFSPKRKWIEESMQEMLEDSEPSQDTPSLPIKQRVKMNLRSLPEATPSTEDSNRPTAISSNFSIERLCSTDSTKDKELSEPSRSPCSYSANDLPPPMHLNTFLPSSYHFKPEILHHESSLDLRSLSPTDSLNLPLKEEKISDGEEMDVDIMSTTPVEKKSFDFSSYNFGKRRSFSVQFKLTVLDAFYNDKDCNKNQRATARKFNINRRQVQKWLSQENDLRSEGSMKNGKYLQRQRLGSEIRDGDGCTRCPQHCLRKKEAETLDKTIEVNVKQCSDKECLTRAEVFHPDGSKPRLNDSTDFYSKTLFPSDLTPTKFYHNYLFPENNNLVYHDSLLAWPHLNASALAVPNFQYLSTWHHNFDFCQENQKIY